MKFVRVVCLFDCHLIGWNLMNRNRQTSNFHWWHYNIHFWVLICSPVKTSNECLVWPRCTVPEFAFSIIRPSSGMPYTVDTLMTMMQLTIEPRYYTTRWLRSENLYLVWTTNLSTWSWSSVRNCLLALRGRKYNAVRPFCWREEKYYLYIGT